MNRRNLDRLTTLHIRKVPVDVKANFKAYCARHGYTMEEAVILLLKYSAKQDITLTGIGSNGIPKVKDVYRESF